MPKFNKTNRTAEELLVVLKRKGLSIADEAKSIIDTNAIGFPVDWESEPLWS